MNKLWVGSLYYFLNVILHTGIFFLLFVTTAPADITTVDYIAELWHTIEGKETITVNSAFLIINLFFALSILYLAPRSRTLLLTLTTLAWLALIFAFLMETVGLVAYAAGALHLSMVSFYRQQE